MSPRELRILLRKAWKDPYYALTNRSCHNPTFCSAFIDQFNEFTFDRPDESLERAFVVRKLAKLTRDPHMIAKATSVLATAYRSEGLPAPKVDALIAEAENLAAECPCCLAEVYRRKGVILLYREDFQEGCSALSSAIEYFDQIGDRDGAARSLISRGFGFYSLGFIDSAIGDEREALLRLSVRSPSRYYISVLINLASILVSAKEKDQARREKMQAEALSIIDNLTEILKGQKRCHERVRVIIRWIKGLIFAAQGDRRSGFRLMFSAKYGLERLGMRSEVIAISADIAKLYKLGGRDNDEQVIELAERCIELFPEWESREIFFQLQRNPEIEVIETMRSASGSRLPSLI